jgi:glyoxylase-like metal-dependent hydrolase (beta-lactamase superfamily II)
MDVHEIAPGLWHWTAPHPEWKPEMRGEDGLGWDEIVSSYALVTDDGLVLIDPQVPTDAEEARRFWEALDRDVEGHGPPAIVISIYWHARSAQEIAERYPGSSIWAPGDSPEGHVPATQTYRAGDALPAGIRAHEVGTLGEVVLYLPSHNAVLFGDTVLDGPRLLPESWLRNDMTRADVANALRPLLDEPIDLLLLTHGGPITDGAHDELQRVVESAPA